MDEDVCPACGTVIGGWQYDANLDRGPWGEVLRYDPLYTVTPCGHAVTEEVVGRLVSATATSEHRSALEVWRG